MTAPLTPDEFDWPALEVPDGPVWDCYAEAVGMPEYCRLRDNACVTEACRQVAQ